MSLHVWGFDGHFVGGFDDVSGFAVGILSFVEVALRTQHQPQVAGAHVTGLFWKCTSKRDTSKYI